MQHCTGLPRQVTFPANTEQEKVGQSLDQRYRLSREEEEEGGDGDGQEKGRRKRKQATDFKEAVCWPSAVAQEAA